MEKYNSGTPKKAEHQFIFDKSNYTFMLLSIAVVVFGFLLMSGSSDIYSVVKIAVAPIVVLIGFAIGFYAILKKRKA